MWYQRVIGRGRCPIVDTWWQTETGVDPHLAAPGDHATKPGSCTLPLPGIEADIVDERGEPVKRPDAGGYLVIKKPWPSMLRTIWGNNARYLAAYWEKFNGRFYVAGDSAHRDKDGYFWIMGRIDDVLNVAGHRLGTMEIESALVANPRVAEAAVVGKPHEIKGESVFAYVVCRGQRPTGDTTRARQGAARRGWRSSSGAIAKPDEIRFADNLPKTRSGKIMRRLLRVDRARRGDRAGRLDAGKPRYSRSAARRRRACRAAESQTGRRKADGAQARRGKIGCCENQGQSEDTPPHAARQTEWACARCQARTPRGEDGRAPCSHQARHEVKDGPSQRQQGARETLMS